MDVQGYSKFFDERESSDNRTVCVFFLQVSLTPSSWILIRIVSALSVYSSSRSCMFELLIKPGVRNLSKLSRSISGILVELQLLEDAVTPNFEERRDIKYDHFRTQSPKPLMAINS